MRSEREPTREMDFIQKAERFIEMHKQLTVLPPEDVNLPNKLANKRRVRKTKELNFQANQALNEMSYLLEEVEISRFFKDQIIYEFASAQVCSWVAWGELQERFMSYYLGISLEKNEFGIFDQNPKVAFKTEANFYYNLLPALKYMVESGMYNPVSLPEWEKSICERATKMQV